MRHVAIVLAAGTALVAGMLAVPPSGLAASAPASPSAASGVPGSQAATEVTLITGDRVVLTHQGGRTAIRTTAADRGPGTAPVSFSSFVLRGDTYVVPSDAAAYAGDQLSWSLFDVSALARGGYIDGAALPLAVHYAKGATPRQLPGLTRRSAGNARAVTEPARQAAQFGKALAGELQADVGRAHGLAAAHKSGQGSLFAGIDSISLDSTTAHAQDPSPAGNRKPDPGFDMQTLTLSAVGRDGKRPSSEFAGNDGFFLVADVDDPAGFSAEIPVTPSRQNWSVPAGSYDIRAFVLTWFKKTITLQNPDGTSDTEVVWDDSMSFVWRPQVAIKHDTALIFDARTATEIPIPKTPDRDTTAGWRSAGGLCCIPQFELVSDRVTPDGTDLPWYWMSGAHALEDNAVGLEVYATPSAQHVSKGSRHFYTYQRLESPASKATYDLLFPASDGSVPGSYPAEVTRKQLAAIPTTYSSEVPDRTGTQARLSYQPWEMSNIRETNPITEPLQRTEYVLADKATRDTLWQEIPAAHDDIFFPDADSMFGPYAAYRPGPQRPVRWFDGPRHPSVAQPGPVVPAGNDVAGGPVTCPVCRGADTLSFDVMPYVDGTGADWGSALNAGNPLFGTLDADSEDLQLHANGALAAERTSASDPGLGSGPTPLPLSPGRARYQLDYSVTRSAPWSSLSTRTETRWDFTSAGPKKSDRLPAHWTCGVLTGSCAFVPLLFLDYSVPLDEHDGVAAPGTVTFTVHVYHEPHAPTTATVDVPTVSISYDDGASWQQVTSVKPAGKGRFAARITTPDPSSITGFVSLKVADSDSTGADISQTIIRAFTLSGSAASRGAGVGEASVPPGGGGGITSGDRRACPSAAAGQAACDAIVHTAAGGAPATSPADRAAGAALPAGYGPADLASAYDLPRSGGAKQTIAVVDAAGDPNIVSDLATYRAEYGMPACTTGTGCLRVVGQDGGGALPAFNDEGWGVETALDLDMVSAACPHCKLLLVVATTPSFADLAAAEQTAARLGAGVISNSYGSFEQVGVRHFAAAYRPQDVVVVASSGDDMFGFGGTLGGTQFPASLPNVTAVGGTRLVPDVGAPRGWAETAWSSGGSGCSAYFAKPAFQQDLNCHMRTVADVAAVADPDTGVAVFDSALSAGGGWLVVGGTSVAAPLIAGMYGLAGNATSVRTPGYLYRHADRFTDVTSGTNGYCGSPVNYLCNAKKGYDGPTGLGTPHGVGGL
jgi:subtilase family protein